MPALASRRNIDSQSRQRFEMQVCQAPRSASIGTSGNDMSTCQPAGRGLIGFMLSGSDQPSCHAEFSRG